jgi:hypothetical protein
MPCARAHVNQGVAISTYHTACGHAHLKRTIAFKRNGKLIASKLPSKFLRDYQKNCAICLDTKKRRKSTPKANSNFTEDLVPWEETYADSSGKFRRKSKRGNYYFTVFVDAKTGDKIVIATQNESISRSSISHLSIESDDTQRYSTLTWHLK